MEKIDVINKFLEENDIKPHELVYWKHKVSNGFDLKKFMADFLDYAESKQSNISAVMQRSEQLIAFCDWYKTTDFNCEGHSSNDCVDEYLKSN